MRRKKTSPPPPVELQQALHWLAEPPQEDPLLELVPLRNHVAAIAALELPLLHQLKIDELLQQRAERIDGALMPLLLDVKLPPPIHLGTIAQGLIDLRAELGETWLKVAGDADSPKLARIHRSTPRLCLHGMFNLSRQFLAASLIAVPTPISLWRNAQALYYRAHESVDPTATLSAEIVALDACFKAMLALSAAQPDGLAPRETAFLANYLETYAAATRIDTIAPETADGWFWLDANLDQAPTSLTRFAPSGGRCLYFTFGELAALAARQVDRLSSGVPPLSIGLPIQAAGADYRNALKRARQSWAEPRRRSFNRRLQALPVAVCTHLSSLWTTLEADSGQAAGADKSELSYSDWTLLSEGPSGYSIEHVLGRVSEIVPGCALGLRTGPDAAWQICLVRWARSKNSTHLELGLEVLAPSARPIRIQVLTGRKPQPPIPALLLPALPSIDRGEAILATRGDFNVRPFTLLQEDEGRLQVVECVPQRSLIETSSVEVFEFARNAKAS